MTTNPTGATTLQQAIELGLSADEFSHIVASIGRAPNITELGIFAALWSEHCSYKSSKRWLKTLPTSGKRVLQGPGENAGAIDIEDGQAAIFKIESHNHPSFIEPYQGAATGVGGIMRDVFTMGARPIANLNALRFGSADHPRTRHLLAGVVAGIGGYGNCMGVPTVGGEMNFHPAYNGNILVNAMTVGIAPADRIFRAKATGPGNPVVYVGSKTGRDGIHGATMASAEFTGDSEQKRPTVQVGDPFTEKLLLEACLTLMESDAIIAIQDMGAAGLTSSAVEMAAKGNLGIELDLDKVPCRESGMSAYEIMLSESQERMLMILRPERLEFAREIFARWELDFATIGVLRDDGRLVLRRHGQIAANIPVAPLVDEAPLYDRPWSITPALPASVPTQPVIDIMEALSVLMGSVHLCSRRWVWEQYDSLVRGDTLQGPGGDAAIVRIQEDGKALAMTVDCTPRYCQADPVQGGRQAVAESWRNLTAVGAEPLAVTNNLNFGNPEKPAIMGQLVGCVKGMAEACGALDYPVISGNVSLYNETDGQAILPTPVIGGVGLIRAGVRPVGIAPHEGDILFLVGDTHGHLSTSLFCSEILHQTDGLPPPVDLARERANGDWVRQLIVQNQLQACHDISDGGLLVAVAEMALAADCGIALNANPTSLPDAAWWFGEDQARYIIAVNPSRANAVTAAAANDHITLNRLGVVGGRDLIIGKTMRISLDKLREGHETTLERLMGDR